LGGVSRRLERLEADCRDRAAAELRRAWANLTDEEVAELLFPYADWVPNSVPNTEERVLEKKVRAAMPAELIATAIGLKNGMEDEEVDRRIAELVRCLGIFERGEGIRRHMLASGARMPPNERRAPVGPRVRCPRAVGRTLKNLQGHGIDKPSSRRPTI
jgi:hypothetical protein